MSMLHKTALVIGLLFEATVVVAFCGSSAFGVAACQGGVVLVGASVAHMAELYLRRAYMEKVRSDEDRRRLEERNEQLKGEKERLQYDVQRKGHVLNDDERSAIRDVRICTEPSGCDQDSHFEDHRGAQRQSAQGLVSAVRVGTRRS